MSMRNNHLQKLGFLVFYSWIAFIAQTNSVQAQTTAGNSSYQFLELPYSAKATSLGGVNISSMGKDLGLAMYNPALLNANMDGQIHVSIKPFFAGIQQYDLSGVNFLASKKTVLGWGIHFMDYGNIPMTDVAGNELGSMHPNDYALQLSASTKYIQNLRIGSTIKFIHSNYGIYRSSALAMDIGLTYLAPSNLSQLSLLVKNMGTQLMTTGHKQDIPFNIILGWSKKLAYAPIQFSITADRISVWNNLYYDPNYGELQGETAPSHLQNIFNHLILATEFYIGDQMDLNVGYNFIRRYDLNIQNQANALNGMSTGLGLRLERTHLQYGTSFFQNNMYHHFTISYQLKK